MPNTLAHFAAQGMPTRAVIRGGDPRWIFLGCVLPDVPWILQRAVWSLPLDPDPYSLRLYVIVQGSLLFCLILGAAVAAVASAPARVFAILGLGAVLHLLLDGLQTRFGEGAHFLAPVSWEIWNVEWFWPGHPANLGLTLFGLGYFGYFWIRVGGGWRGLLEFSALRVTIALPFVLAYLLLPLALTAGPEVADNHSVKTLRDHSERPGRDVEFDRREFWIDSDGRPLLRTFAGEILELEGPVPDAPSTVSIRGTFIDEETVLVRELHDHRRWPRDLASYLGLILLVLIWTVPLRQRGHAARGSADDD